MDFLKLPDRVNTLLYRREVRKLSRGDGELAVRWTLALIRERNPRWSEAEVRAYYDNLLNIRVTVADDWSARNGAFPL